ALCRAPTPPRGRWTGPGAPRPHRPAGAPRRIDLDEFQRFLAAQGRPPYPAGGGARTRLLIVDDEPLVVAMLVDLLSGGPFTVETATDGYEALVKVGTFRPAVIILDAVLPGLD